jgi:hypothetical protein
MQEMSLAEMQLVSGAGTKIGSTGGGDGGHDATTGLHAVMAVQ